ncbi:NAD(P)/FAD-dependent oxidoreductase [Desulfohalovibrio reitneri]|uniref:NAD(P)/FAD-dependent oxidoreductase n=1 Tax=Desulfohalovibrio reitneri TaxID=1307759 RepID=UPI0009DD08F1|nr:NAD(P)/FAD-dependent oxidoreductase [Desulfohalovibrio reitneri]
MHDVVIAGAGFSGLWAARALAGKGLDVLVVDKNNYHTFLPLLYQVAAAELESEQIAYPVRGIFRNKGARGVNFAMATAIGLDTEANALHTDQGRFHYRHLVLGLGSVTHFFGVPGAVEHSFRLKYLEQAMFLRNHILGRFERAMLTSDPAEQRRALTFTVVGGGPTGLEYAGALAELIRGPLTRDYPHRIAGQARVVLLEALDNVLPGFPERLREDALMRLRRKGAEVRLAAMVAEVGPDFAALRDGSRIPTDTVVWTAGVRAHPLLETLGLPLADNGQVLCRPDLRVKGFDNIWAAGDCCRVEEAEALPMIAPVAIQQGRHVGRSIWRVAKGKQAKPFRYRDKGSLATIGRGAAVARLGKRGYTGFTAWVIWLFVHLLYLVGFRNRLVVLINWAWDYFFFERAVRLILPREWLWHRAALKQSGAQKDPEPPGPEK